MFTIQSLGEGRGRGVVATQDTPKGAVLYVTAPDIATLYSPFARVLCARCFAAPATSSESNAAFACPTCDQFVLCARCHAAHEQGAGAGEETDTSDGRPSVSLKAVHRLACAWFNELPAAVRAPDQDTDYLRFCLHYGARRALGDEAIRDRLMQLEGNVASQSEENLRFCEVFARDRVVATFGGSTQPPSPSSLLSSSSTQRYTVPWEELRDVLIRTRCNSLGFPFNADATTGWSLEGTVCMLNHNCEPNVAVVMAEMDDACARWSYTAECSADGTDTSTKPHATDVRQSLAGMIGIKTIRDVRAGEELCISYVDSEEYDSDVTARTRHLLEQYRFVCRCAKCMRQRAALKAKK